MTNPSEKIRQVVEKNIANIEDYRIYSSNGVRRSVLDSNLVLIDAIIDVLEGYYDDVSKQQVYVWLKEARTSITNSTHE